MAAAKQLPVWQTEYQILTAGVRLKYALLIFGLQESDEAAKHVPILSIIWPIMKKNPSKSYDFDGFWLECNYRTWKNPDISMVLAQ